METGLTEDALLGGRVRLLQPSRGYRVAVDAVLLAASVEAAGDARILDLGAGVGAVGLCLAARLPRCRVIGIELQESLATLAQRNARLNGVEQRVQTLAHDLAAPLPVDLGLFDHVATNPPYLAAAVADPSPNRSKALATVESSVDLARWLAVATAAAKPAGNVFIVHRSDRLEEIVCHLDALGWSDVIVKRLPPAARVLVRARRSDAASHHEGHRQGHREAPPLVLHRPDGRYTDEAEAVLRHAAALAF
jgi:tRNA1(Val) A37 N6-methylase TrmN6